MPGGLESLKNAGVPVENLSERAKAALDDLSPQEVDTMARIRARLLAAASEDDVTGFGWTDIGIDGFSPDEADTMSKIRSRLQDAGVDDVEGFAWAIGMGAP